jgi:hypothetical protein
MVPCVLEIKNMSAYFDATAKNSAIVPGFSGFSFLESLNFYVSLKFQRIFLFSTVPYSNYRLAEQNGMLGLTPTDDGEIN